MLSKISIGAALVAAVANAQNVEPCEGKQCGDDFISEEEKPWDWRKMMERPEAEQMMAEYKEFQVEDFVNIQPRRAYCRMQRNPVYPTTNPWGWFQLWQWTPSSPVYIWGNMYQLPPPNSDQHALAINSWAWNRKDCASSGPHLQAAGQTHSSMNSVSSHNGDLTPLNSVGNNAWYFAVAMKPDLFSLMGTENVVGKAMTVYEFGDDLGTSDTYASQWYGSACKEIACCNIRRFEIKWPQEIDYEVSVDEDSKTPGRDLGAMEEDVDYFTPEGFRELFGYEPEPENFDIFGQN